MNRYFVVNGVRPIFMSRLQGILKRCLRNTVPLLLLALALPVHSATVPGATPGNFVVSESGAATYSVPFAVPPGTAGMEPKLSLNYSSQSSNGIAGVGWSLGGLSAITRCPQTIVHDGATRGLQLDASDRFCLDGQRLILTAGATYGSVGAEYRTEIESFSKIVSIGGTAGDPQSFKVWTKAGQIIEFGNTADARAEAQGKTVAVAWAANKVSDTVGNYITFTYFEDNANGEHRITRIDYTGNESLAPYNVVEFLYETRPDPSSGYLVGSRMQASQRLANIQTKANGALVMDFQLDYEIGTTTGRSRLVGLRQCAGNGDCLNPMVFGWQEGEAASFDSVAIESAAQTGASSNTWFSMGDVNADGRTDVVTLNTSRDMRLYTADVTGLLTQTQQFITPFVSTMPGYFNPMDWRFWMDDLNGDGRVEPIICGVVGQYATNGFAPWVVVPWATVPQAGGQATIQMQATNALYLGQLPPQVMTYTQGCMGTSSTDGKGDFVWHAAEYYKGFALVTDVTVAGGYGTATFTQEGASVPLRNSNTSVTLNRDIDGDGNGDMVRYDPSTGALHTWLQRNKAFAAVQSTTIDAGGTPYDRWFTAADVNGDGLADMVLHTPADGKLKVWLSKGNGTVTGKFETTGFSTGGTPSDTWFLMADVNSDGRADAIKYRSNLGDITISLSNGDGTFGVPFSGSIGAGVSPTPTLGPNPTTSWFQPADINGDGLPDWVRYDPAAGKIKVNLGLGAVPDLLLTIADGHGASRSIAYKPLTDPAVYTKGAGATYPEQDVQAAMYVVAETAADDGIGGQFRNAYRYEGARTHLTGRGFLGFKAVEQTDLQSGITIRSEFSQSFPHIGTPLLVIKSSSGGVELSRVENTPASKTLNAGKTFFSYIAYSKEQSKDLNGTVLPSTETWNTYGDDWGNLTKTISQTSDGFKKQTDNTYSNDVTKWHLGRLTRSSVTSTINNGGWSQTRVSAFEYHATTGLLTKEIIEPDQPQYRLDTVYAHDVFGNRQSVTVSSPATGLAAITTRSTTITYDPKGQFPVNTANALGHTETKTFDPRFGVVTNLTGPNALTTSWQYDSFGRKTRETRADGTFTLWTYAGCDVACPANGIYRIVTQVYGGGVQSAPVTVSYFDRINREIRSATQGFDARWIYKDTQYDGLGRVAQASRPYFAGEAIYWSRSEYDDLGRVVRVYEPDEPDNAALIVDYNGLSITRTNRKGQITAEVSNSQGQKISVTDALGSVTTYGHDPFGNLQFVQNNGALEAMNGYDIRGHKTVGYTPDMRTWTYVHNALGELVQQTDAKSQVTTMVYDKLGRMTQRVEPGLTSNWIYDTAAYGKGKLYQAKTNAGYIRTHYYDNKGRPQLTLSNLGAGNPLLFSSVAYDAAGRVEQTYYPSGLGIKNVYNATGYLAEVRKAQDNTLYWQQNVMDAEGHSIQETLGNGSVSYTAYDPRNGRFNYRIDNRNGTWIVYHSQIYDSIGNVSERYQLGGPFSYDILAYDALNRLTQTDSTVGGLTSTQAVVYAAGGNISSKTGVGDYSYGSNANCAAGSNAGTHAVCKAGSNTYAYDLNGNLTGGGGRAVTWTSWNMPASLTQGGNTTSWLYGPERDRYKMIAPGRTTWYLNPSVHQGGHYEQTLYASGTSEHRHTIYGGGKPIGEVLTFTAEGTALAPQTRYFHSDAQGSITAVTDQNGQVITRYRYDPWGKQTLVSGSNTGIDATRQGHTGHEMLDGGITHMNGRLYDPMLARFVSADPYVQAPYNPQSLNRYSYVFNNPLGYTDPSGYFGFEVSPKVGRILQFGMGIAFSAVLGPAGPGALFGGGSWAATIANGAIAGGVGGFIASGGNAQAARQGAFAGGLFAGAGLIGNGLDKAGYGGFANNGIGRAALHAAAGCISASAGGGSCGTGAMTAGFTKFAGSNLPNYGGVGNLIKYAVIGGTAAEIGGGKFSNGAMTGAWQYLFNELFSDQAWMDENGKIHRGRHPDFNNGTCARNGMCAAKLSEPQRGKDGQILLGTAAMVGTGASGVTGALIWAGRGTATIMTIDTVASTAGTVWLGNQLYQATNGGDFPVTGSISATTGFFGDMALKLDGHQVGGPLKLIGPVIEFGSAVWGGSSQ